MDYSNHFILEYDRFKSKTIAKNSFTYFLVGLIYAKVPLIEN